MLTLLDGTPDIIDLLALLVTGAFITHTAAAALYGLSWRIVALFAGTTLTFLSISGDMLMIARIME